MKIVFRILIETDFFASNYVNFGYCMVTKIQNFLHTSTLVQQRKNYIIALHDDDGSWKEDKVSMCVLLMDKFFAMFYP